LNADRAAVFRRVGWTLVAIGAADTAVLVWALARDLFYPSPFNVFALAAGVLMLRGNVTTAALVRWTLAFTLASIAAALPLAPVLVDTDFMRAVARLHPAWTGAALAALAVTVLLFGWMQYELERGVIAALLAEAGKRWRLRGAVLAGLAATLVLVGLVAVMLRGEFADEAVSRAKSQLGSGYRYQVVMLGVFFERRGPYVSARVAGWNEREIRVVPIRWTLVLP
jgi:hypothetical protein